MDKHSHEESQKMKKVRREEMQVREKVGEKVKQGNAVDFEIQWVEEKKQDHAKDVRLAPESGPEVAGASPVQAIRSEDLMKVDPLEVPPDATERQHLEMMARQMDQLRQQGLQSQQLLAQNQQLLVQSQQLLVQGLFALIQQQNIQNANLERALTALTNKMGVEMPPPTRAPEVDLLKFPSAALGQTLSVPAVSVAPAASVKEEEALPAAAESPEVHAEPDDGETTSEEEPLESEPSNPEVQEAVASSAPCWSQSPTKMARARLHLSLATEESPVSSRSLTKDSGRGAKGKQKSSTLELPRSQTLKLPEISVPSPRTSESDELLMPTSLSFQASKVRHEVEAPATPRPSQSMPLSSFRDMRRLRVPTADRRDELELLKLKDLAQHYRRCTTLELDDAGEGLERSDSKSTRAETEASSPGRELEVKQAFEQLEIDFDVAFENIANITFTRCEQGSELFWRGVRREPSDLGGERALHAAAAARCRGTSPGLMRSFGSSCGEQCN
eukprot:s3252_g6.t1